MVSQMLEKGKNIVGRAKMIKELQQRDVKISISLEKNEVFLSFSQWCDDQQIHGEAA